MTVVVYIWVHKVYLELVESINISNIFWQYASTILCLIYSMRYSEQNPPNLRNRRIAAINHFFWRHSQVL